MNVSPMNSTQENLGNLISPSPEHQTQINKIKDLLTRQFSTDTSLASADFLSIFALILTLPVPSHSDLNREKNNCLLFCFSVAIDPDPSLLVKQIDIRRALDALQGRDEHFMDFFSNLNPIITTHVLPYAPDWIIPKVDDETLMRSIETILQYKGISLENRDRESKPIWPETLQLSFINSLESRFDFSLRLYISIHGSRTLGDSMETWITDLRYSPRLRHSTTLATLNSSVDTPLPGDPDLNNNVQELHEIAIEESLSNEEKTQEINASLNRLKPAELQKLLDHLSLESPKETALHIFLYLPPNILELLLKNEGLTKESLFLWIEASQELSVDQKLVEDFLDIFARSVNPEFFSHFDFESPPRLKNWIRERCPTFFKAQNLSIFCLYTRPFLC